jgi:hypothetical protein
MSAECFGVYDEPGVEEFYYPEEVAAAISEEDWDLDPSENGSLSPEDWEEAVEIHRLQREKMMEELTEAF